MIAKMEKQELKQGNKPHESKQSAQEAVKGFETELKKDVEAKAKVIEDYENTMKRLQADFENYVKRTQKEKEDFAKVSIARVLVKFVDIMDDLDRTMIILEKTTDAEVKTGIKMVHARFHKILAEEGIKQFDSKGKKVDPFQHEVIEMVVNDSPEGIVVEGLQKGYVMNDKILRAAKVRVSKGKENKK